MGGRLILPPNVIDTSDTAMLIGFLKGNRCFKTKGDLFSLREGEIEIIIGQRSVQGIKVYFYTLGIVYGLDGCREETGVGSRLKGNRQPGVFKGKGLGLFK